MNSVLCPVIITACVILGWATQGSGQRAETPVERILHFSPEWSVGRLASRPAQPEEPTHVSHYWYRDDDSEPLGEARGDVVAPAGHQVGLSVSHLREWRDLSPLLKLHPDDLYRLTIHGSYSGGSKPGDSCMEYVGHLTGLRILDLHFTNISGAAMKHVVGLKNLIRLTISGRMDDQGMAFIAELPSLKGLYFGENRVTDAGLRHLARLDSLEELRLGGGKITDAGLVHLAQLTHLEYLAIWGRSFTDDGFKHLKGIRSLGILDLGSLHQVTDAGLAHLAEISQLTDLNLYWSAGITDAGLSHLKKLPHLRKLDIGQAKVTDAGMVHLKAIPTLESLSLPLMGITDKGLQHLSELPRLREIHLPWVLYTDPNRSKDGYTDEGIKALSRCTSLEDLSIGGVGITDEAFRHIAKLTHMKNLNIWGSGRITDESLQVLAGLRSLEILHLSGFRLSLSGVKSFSVLTNLRTLNVHGVVQDNTGIDLSGLANLRELSLYFERPPAGKTAISGSVREQDIAAIGKLTGLRRLSISHQGMTNEALKSLTGLERLESLFIGGDDLTDDGLVYLAELPRLSRLSLSGHFTDAGLVHLQRLRNLGMLDFMSGANFSPRALSDFRASMPNLGLYRDFEKKQELRNE